MGGVVCDGVGACKLDIGQTCVLNSDCAGNFCGGVPKVCQ
jgi:hypothetical protein